jgi:hypothetical protein
MARKMSGRPTPPGPDTGGRAAVTPERFNRLYRLLQMLATGPQTRQALARRLQLDVRGFYRDLEVLRSAGITILQSEGRYALQGEAPSALARLPFPDPRLTFGEVQQLVKGRTAAHKRIKEQIDELTS